MLLHINETEEQRCVDGGGRWSPAAAAAGRTGSAAGGRGVCRRRCYDLLVSRIVRFFPLAECDWADQTTIRLPRHEQLGCTNGPTEGAQLPAVMMQTVTAADLSSVWYELLVVPHRPPSSLLLLSLPPAAAPALPPTTPSRAASCVTLLMPICCSYSPAAADRCC